MLFLFIVLSLVISLCAGSLVTDLALTSGDYSACPTNYTIIAQNLQDGTKMKSVYMCYASHSGKPAITSIEIASSADGCPVEYDLVADIDVNANGSVPMYICSTTSTFGGNATGISKISFVVHDKGAPVCAKGLYQLNRNFNEGQFKLNMGPNVQMCVDGNMAVYPRQAHLAFTHSVTTMSFSWQTPGLNLWTPDLSAQYKPIVKYGTSSGKYTSTVNAQASQYYISHQYDAVLVNLTAGTTYYAILGDKNLGFSQEYVFQAQAKQDAEAHFQFLLVGDMGIMNSDDTLADMITLKDKNSFVYHVGDYAYADDRDNVGENPLYEPILDQFMESLVPLASQLPYMMCPGNHDGSCHSSQNWKCPPQTQNFTAYRNRWNMPSADSGYGMWYSFNYQNVHFISISSETDYPHAPSQNWTDFGARAGPFGDQLGWLKADLEAASQNRDKYPWIVAIGHRPMYSSIKTDFPLNAKARFREAFEDLFNEYHVDLYISGHVHSYERMWPTYNKSVVQKDYHKPSTPVYVVNGAAGNIEGHSEGYKNPVEDYTAFVSDDTYGYSEVEVYNSTTLRFAFYDAASDATIDEFFVVRGSNQV